MEVGKAYIVHGGDWHTFVGRVVRQVSPLVYEMGMGSKIIETNNGDVWNEMAAGDKRLREAAGYAHIKTTLIVPLTIAAIEWVGKTPQEEGL